MIVCLPVHERRNRILLHVRSHIHIPGRTSEGTPNIYNPFAVLYIAHRRCAFHIIQVGIKKPEGLILVCVCAYFTVSGIVIDCDDAGTLMEPKNEPLDNYRNSNTNILLAQNLGIVINAFFDLLPRIIPEPNLRPKRPLPYLPPSGRPRQVRRNKGCYPAHCHLTMRRFESFQTT